jgi:hypothetical protein
MSGALRGLLAGLPYEDARRIVTLMNDGAGEPRAEVKDANGVTDPTGALAALMACAPFQDGPVVDFQSLDGTEYPDCTSSTVTYVNIDCPACGDANEHYERGGLADASNGDDAGPTRYTPFYLECAACGAWFWPLPSLETSWQYQRALSALAEPGDVWELAALEFSAEPEYAVKKCKQCRRAPVEGKQVYCARRAADRKKVPNAKDAYLQCCIEWQQRTGTRQRCPYHDQYAGFQHDHNRRLIMTPDKEMLRDHFGTGIDSPRDERNFGIARETLPYDCDAAAAWLAVHDKHGAGDDSE